MNTTSDQRLHWQKGMFLRNKSHGEAMLELRDREFHIYAQAVWPRFFMGKLRATLQQLITDNWDGLRDRYYFAVPCLSQQGGKACSGRFDIDALHEFLDKGDKEFPCQTCRKKQDIVKLLFGFEKEDPREQLLQIEMELKKGFDEVLKEIGGLRSRIANYVMAIMWALGDESKEGPRLFSLDPVDGDWKQLFNKDLRLRLWCEAEDCQHPVSQGETGLGIYRFKETRQWVETVAPYANFIAGVLKTVLPIAAPAANVLFGENTIDAIGIKDHLDLMKEATGKLKGEVEISRSGLRENQVLTEPERSGVLALHSFLRDKDPTHKNLGLERMPTYTGEYVWLCKEHFELAQSKIPDKIE